MKPRPIALLLLCLGSLLALPLQAQATSSVLTFGAVADGVMRTDGSMTAGSPVLSSPSGSFAPGDRGKYIQVVGAGPGAVTAVDGAMSPGSSVLTSSGGTFTSDDIGRGIVVAGAGPSGGNLVASIQSYSSPASVTLSAPAQTAVASASYFYGGMTLEATIQSVQSSSSVTLSTPALATISGAMFAYGTDNHVAFQAAVDSAGAAGGGQVNVPAPAICPSGAVCGYILTATDQLTAIAPGAVKIRYSNVSLIGDSPQTNLFCRGAYGTYTNSAGFPQTTGNIRGFCLSIGDDGGPNGVAGESVSNVTISHLHLYGMTNGNTNRLNFAYPPQTSDSWDITHKGIYMWDKGTFSNITIDSLIIQDFKAENIYSGGSPLTGMVIQNSTFTNFNGNGISMLAADLQVLNNTISNGSNAAVENSTESSGSKALIRQLYQGNTISQFPREGIVVVGVDNGVTTGSISILNNNFDTIAQANASGTESAIYIAGQQGSVPPANVTVAGNNCHDCYSFGVFQTSGNTVVQGNTFTVDQYSAGSVFSFAYSFSNVIFSGNTGSVTAQAQANNLSVRDVFVVVPRLASGGFNWSNVVVANNSWVFPGAPEYQFVTTVGPGWSQISGHNLRWEGNSCTGCTHADADHGLVDLSQTTTIEPYGPTVYVTGNTSPVTATVDAGKEEDGSEVQIVNAGSSAVSFASDINLSLPYTVTLPGGSSSTLSLIYSGTIGKFALATSAASIVSSGGDQQSANLAAAFSAPLQVKVTDIHGAPVAGATVIFTAPGSGPSATFSGSKTVSAVTLANGIASSPVPIANGRGGIYAVTASIPGVPSSAYFTLTNISLSGVSGALTGIADGSSGTASLTTEGGADWVHWGDSSLNRKSGVTPQIGNYSVVGSGPVATYTNDPRALSWSDGAPAVSGTNNNGIYINSLQNGFSFTVPSDLSTRKLIVHAGGWLSGGTFTASLSDASADDFVDTTSPVSGQYDRNYTLTYNAVSAGQTLTVKWVATSGGGNVTLNGAAVSILGPSLAATAGTPQSATVGTAFGTALKATVKDAGGNPLSGVSVTFTAPASGASAAFSGSSTATAMTNASGVATAPALTANTQSGAYTVTAAAVGVSASASFNLTNTPGAPASISASSGTPQSTAVSSAFPTVLQALVKDAYNNPVSGVSVTFTAPATGAGAAFSGSATATVTTNASGLATAPPLTANNLTGAYTVTAAATGVSAAAAFSLTNNSGPPASIAATAGTPQSAAISGAFTTALQATVKDAGNNPLSGVTVTFTTPASGPGANFSGLNSAAVTTNSSGIALAPALAANSQAGSYTVTATAAGLAAPASFSLTNLAGAPASITTNSGTPQSATVKTAFPTALQALVKDAGSNPLSGVTVTFTAPATGPSAAFNGSATATATTNAAGIATAPALTANSQAGSYTVTAATAGIGTPASFSLTNLAGSPASVSATAGTPQSAAIGTAFASSLQAAVKDANNNPLSGIAVTFTAPANGPAASFSGSSTATAITNASGIATAPTLTANSQVGLYPVTATAPGVSGAASFALSNAGVVSPNGVSFVQQAAAANLGDNRNTLTVALSGAPSSGDVLILFFDHVSAAQTITSISGATWTRLAQNASNGDSEIWAGTSPSSPTITITGTNYFGLFQPGYAIVAEFAGVSAILDGSPLYTASGTWPITTGSLNTGNAGDLLLSSTLSYNGGGVNAAVRSPWTLFNAPGGTYSLAAGYQSVNATGSYSATWNGIGSPQVPTIILGLKAAASLGSIAAGAGTPQSAAVNTAFGTALQATVKDPNNNPLSGVSVTFTAPATGPSAAFSGSLTATATTNASGIATAPALTANSQAGAYSVTASAVGVANPASFSLTNTPGPPASITATAGTPQSAIVLNAFTTALQTTVKDASNNPLSGVTVTFTAPATGASAAFNGSATATATTNASGIATAPALTANGQAGNYAVTASVTGLSTSASFPLSNTAAPPASITAIAGTPQSTAVLTAFTTALQATVKDTNNNPLSGVSVTFTAPTTGPSAAFSGSLTATATTNASGIATASILTANSQAGAYTVIASTAGLTPTASFSLTNTPGPPASITATAGTPQSAIVLNAFTTALQTTVKDASNNPLSGVTVTFTAPPTGPSAAFNGSATATATTNASGIAAAPALTANGQAGNYAVTASVTGVSTSASFALSNTAAPPASITAITGTPQSTAVATAFTTALQATVKDTNNNPLSGVSVTFTAPTTGPTAAFSGSNTAVATTNASGIATAPALTANSQAGAYTVIASTAGLTPTASFSLTNTPGPPASITATAGTPQSAIVLNAFTTALQTTVKDASNNPLSGVTVTFTAPATGASAAFNGSASATATTNASGIAAAPALTANGQAGNYAITASAAGLTPTASFSLTNTPGSPASISASAGTPQSAAVGAVFSTALQIIVKDASNNPVSGVSVTFTVPASGPGATFGGSNAATATTNASGLASAPALTANNQAGAYTVTAGAAGLATPASFSLTNTAGAPASIAAIAGTPQSAAVNVAFTTALQVIVKDASNNPVSGVSVAFTAPTTGATSAFSGLSTAAVTTNASGIACAPALTANNQPGSYTITASVTGVSTAASFVLSNTTAPPASITATSGTPQSAAVGTAFTTPLQAAVKDSNNNPLSGVTVTFIAPASGPGAAFNGLSTATAATNASGIATAPTPIANSQLGGYSITASVTGVPAAAAFSLTNTAGAPASIAVSAGTPQSATVGVAFGTLLQAVVKDAGNNPVSGVSVTFTAPASGPSAAFSGLSTAIAITNSSGIATAPALTANNQAGAYTIAASTAQVTAPASFSLTNTAGAAAIITASVGTPQSGSINTLFSTALQAAVRDANNNPVSGATVTFTAPATGPGAAFSGSANAAAVTNASGIATAPALTANNQLGSYAVTASTAGVTAPANFSLTNTPGPPASITAIAGSPQSATVGTAFVTALQVTVNDSGNNPVSGVSVTFTAPASGPGAAFTGSVTAMATTNASGIATAPALTANNQAGAYTIAASTTGVTAASFSLTNTPGAPASITAAAGTSQSASVNTVFTTPLRAAVKDASNNPVSGVTVTFTTPATGPGAAFSGLLTATASTNASGIATAPTLLANGQLGSYAVTASVTGVSTAASFTLTNTAGVPASISAAAGTPQSATAGTSFGAALEAIVKDSNNNPLSGVSVTFTAPASGPGAAFSGSLIAVAISNASGIATAPALTANMQAGAYTVTASTAGLTSSFSLTNTAGAPASVTAIAGTPQSATVGTVFFTALQALVTDAGNNPVSGAMVTFTAPASGPGAAFGGSITATAATNSSGVATAPTLIANSQTGSYTVTASAAGVSLPASFVLINGSAVAAIPVSLVQQAAASNVGNNQNTLTLTLASAPGGSNVLILIFDQVSASQTIVSITGATWTRLAQNYSGNIGDSEIWIGVNPTSSAITITGANYFGLFQPGYAIVSEFAGVGTTLDGPALSTTGGVWPVTTASLATNSANDLLITSVLSYNGGGVNASVRAPWALFSAPGGTYSLAAGYQIANAAGSYAATWSGIGSPQAATIILALKPAGAQGSIAAAAGNSQSATVNTGFPTALQAIVTDGGGHPVSGATVTFTTPASGASAAFAGSSSATAVTNSSGVATAAPLTANTQAGSYTVTATTPGISATASFALSNSAGPPASITSGIGTPQSASLNTTFATALQAAVKDANGNPVSGVTVTFSAPISGASAAFSGSATVTAATNASGIATAPTLTANGQIGSYTVTASATGVSTNASFALTNTTPPPASVTPLAGTPQSATVNAAFTTALQATVKDANNNPLSGINVTFTAPANGPGAAFSGLSTAVAATNASGIATAPALTANSLAGSYAVTATAPGLSTGAAFALSNTPGPPASITATSGTPQSTVVSTAFGTALQAAVKDANGNPLSGVSVIFSAPASGPGAAFSGSSSATVVTNNSGIATAPTLTANSQIGSYPVAASTAGVSAAASFSLTNSSVVVASPVALIQQAAGSNGGDNRNTLTVALPGTPASTNTLVLIFDQVSASQTITSISGATWTRVAQNYTGNIGDSEIWVGTSPTSAVITITGTNYFGLFQPGYAIVAEFSGISATLDGSARNTASGMWPVTSASLATSSPGDLLITSTLAYSGGGVRATVSGPWSLFAAPGGTYSLSAAYRTVNTTGSYSATWSGNGSPQVSTIILALKAGSS